MVVSAATPGIKPETLTKQAIVEALWRRVVDDATGRSESPMHRYGGDTPEKRFWLGVLHPEYEVTPPEDTGKDDSDFAERFRPASQGFSFKVETLPVKLAVRVSLAIWMRLHPTLDEQRGRVGVDVREEEPAPPGGSNKTRHKLSRVLTKVPVQDVSVTLDLDKKGYGRYGRRQLREALRGASKQAENIFELLRPLKPGGKRPADPDVAYDGAWRAWTEANCAAPVVPVWNVRVDAQVRGGGGGEPFEVLLTVVNDTARREDQPVQGTRKPVLSKDEFDPRIYEVELSCETTVDTVPYELEQIPDSYRYDRRVPVLGINSAAESHGRGFRTAFAAVARTSRVYPRTADPQSGEALDVSFTALKDDPMPALEALLDSLEAWTGANWDTAALDSKAKADGWLPDTRNQAEGDADNARREVDWFRAGVELLRTDPEMLKAFKLMNETVEFATRKKDFSAWHPFQLAYVVGCLPGLKRRSPQAPVEILWFNTGGGKTEAYLGLNAVAMFYGRLKGRQRGSQTWARFPLRLLSLQQTQRMAESVISAEVVRRRHSDIPALSGKAPFSVGYYVGDRNTPNSIELPSSRFYEGWNPFDDATAGTCRVLETCPACQTGARPVVRFDKESHTLEHVCSNPVCDFHNERLPVYVVDDDIYRRAPTVIVGTVDKLVSISQNRNFRILLGGPLSVCPKHGYSVQADRCTKWGCDESLRPVPGGFGGLEMEIQDELHLLKESLGALDGNYETLFHRVAQDVGGQPVKIVGATATIEGFEEQAHHLYNREAMRFPVPGPTKEESFWAYEVPGDPLRTYVAMLPRGTTMLNAGYFVALSHRRFFAEALGDPAHFCLETDGLDGALAAEVAGYLRDYYEVMVSYSLRKRDLERHATDVAADPEIIPHERNYDSITGDVPFEDVRGVLDRLERPPASDDERVWLLGATSAISHGVDINRLNVMTMMGMPQQTSEYIQTTARVGRAHPAAVFSLINPTRRRDVSHFRYFAKYAEYLDRLVEPVPINREALPVLKRVLPGGFMSLLLQLEEPEWLYPGGEAPAAARRRLFHLLGTIDAIDNGQLEEEDVIRWLRRAFAIPEAGPQFDAHRKEIERYVRELFELLLAKRGENDKERTADHMDPPPPRSLRDVEKSIEIKGER